MSKLEPLLLLKSGQSLFGIELRYVREIVSDFPVFSLPVKLDSISHLTMLRGTPYAVLNSEYFLRFEHEVRDKLVVLIGQMAIFVNEAVQSVSPEELTSQESESENETPFVKTVVQYRNRIIPVLDIQAILNDRPDFNYVSI